MNYRTILLLLLIPNFTNAQSLQDPVKWEQQITKKRSDNYEIKITGNILKRWHIYSQNMNNKLGPQATRITFKNNPLVHLNGKPSELGKKQKMHVEEWDADLYYFSGTVTYVQQIKFKAGVKTTLQCSIDYMLCNDEQCLPGTIKMFQIKL